MRSDPADGGVVAVGFLDLAGYTTMTAVHGDESAADVAEQFGRLVAGALGPADELVKTIGDGALELSPTPGGQVLATDAVVRRLDGPTARAPSGPYRCAGSPTRSSCTSSTCAQHRTNGSSTPCAGWLCSPTPPDRSARTPARSCSAAPRA